MTDGDDREIDVEAVDGLDSVDDLADLDTEDLADIDMEELPDPENLDFDQLGPLLEQANSMLESFTDDGDEGSRVKDVQTLLTLANLIRGALKTTDVDELLETINFEEIDSVVDFDALPDALESGDLGDAVELKNVRRLVKFGQLWKTVDLTDLIRSRDEISEAVDSLTGDDGDGEGLLDGMDLDLDQLAGGGDALGGLKDPEMIQAATQAELDKAVEGFRDILIETHARLDGLREANARRIEGVGQPSSRNPTAYSTLSTHRGPARGTSHLSTVPRGVRHSSGPSRRRIYGDRFKRLMEEKKSEESDDRGTEPEQSTDATDATDTTDTAETTDATDATETADATDATDTTDAETGGEDDE